MIIDAVKSETDLRSTVNGFREDLQDLMKTKTPLMIMKTSRKNFKLRWNFFVVSSSHVRTFLDPNTRMKCVNKADCEKERRREKEVGEKWKNDFFGFVVGQQQSSNELPIINEKFLR